MGHENTMIGQVDRAQSAGAGDRGGLPVHFVPAHRPVADPAVGPVTGDTRLSGLLAARPPMLRPGRGEDRTTLTERRLELALARVEALQRELTCLREAARRDSLTGLLNRTAMETLIVAACGTTAGCAVAFIDVDRFKTINDSLGHAAGDRVLRAFADALRQGLGEHPLARWGGEEFVLLLRGSNATRAHAMVDAVRAKLSGNGLPTFSAGVAISDGCGMEELVHRADRLLYRAKHDGRNRVVIQ